MLTFGWIEEMPAILDEYGVVIDGNRRMIVAELRFNSWLGGAVEIYSQGEAMISLPCKIQGIMKA